MANVVDAVNRHLRQNHKLEQKKRTSPGSRHLGGNPGTGSDLQVPSRHGEFSHELVDSPEPSDDSSSSGESMTPHGDEHTPPESPIKRHSPTAEASFERLSLEHNHARNPQPHTTQDRDSKPLASSKRAASSDLPRKQHRQCPDDRAKLLSHASGTASRGRPRQKGRGYQDSRDVRANQNTNVVGIAQSTPNFPVSADPVNFEAGRARPHMTEQVKGNPRTEYNQPPWHDSGYGSRQNTICQPSDGPPTASALAHTAGQRAIPQPAATQTGGKQRGILTLPQKARWPGMILQPDSCPISEDQLTAEIKAIYAGLVVVEAKCINVDAAQACDPSAELDQGRWQALIGLHRTLLYEHHDFLMATQHPSATPALRALPTKYSMPARMWKHGIHGFLEVLRHRRPELQDYMVSFIYLAYQMMALLYETVPTFLDTWIECLGDLARYRMAIEEEREEHAQWAGVAASWYIKASDRHPQIGRLYHHLAILERPSLRKFACYGKSLTCVVPFPNARESLHTLCGPIAEEPQPARAVVLQTEAAFCKLHAVIFLAKSNDVIYAALNTALSSLQRPDAFKWRDCGVPLAVANISALLGHGAATNPLRIAFDRVVRRTIQRSRPSHAGTINVAGGYHSVPALSGNDDEESRRLLTVAKQLVLSSLHTCLRCLPGTAFFRDSLAFVGVMLCFLHFFALAKKETDDEPDSQLALCLVFGLDEVAWSDVAGYLNHITRMYPVTPHIVRSAQQGTWLENAGDSKPLPEDYSIRGLVWSYFAFCQGWFDSDEDQDWVRTVESASTHKARGDRAIYYGLRIAYETGYLTYDSTSRTFSSSIRAGSASTHSLQSIATNAQDASSQQATAASAPPTSPTTSGQASYGSDSDFVHVRHPARPDQSRPQPQRTPAPTHASVPPPAKTWAAVAKAGSKSKPAPRTSKPNTDIDMVRVVDSDQMEWNSQI